MIDDEEIRTCMMTDRRLRIEALLKDIVELESQRDKIGRHTNISATFEALMNKHEGLFKDFNVAQLPPKNAS